MKPLLEKIRSRFLVIQKNVTLSMRKNLMTLVAWDLPSKTRSVSDKLRNAMRRFFGRISERSASGTAFLRHLTDQSFSKRVKNSFSSLYAKYIVRGDYTLRNFVALLVLAVLLGVFVKAVVHNSLTIGYSDYTLAPSEKIIDLNLVQKRVLEKGGSLTLSGSTTAGPTCSE